MSELALIISIIALILSIVALKRVGGLEDIKSQIDNVESVMGTLKEKTANVLGRMEKALRNDEKVQEPEKKE
ncbi:MAG: hypothetical protein ABIJ37_09995 [Pseudomonadota bacterium]